MYSSMTANKVVSAFMNELDVIHDMQQNSFEKRKQTIPHPNFSKYHPKVVSKIISIKIIDFIEIFFQ